MGAILIACIFIAYLLAVRLTNINGRIYHIEERLDEIEKLEQKHKEICKGRLKEN